MTDDERAREFCRLAGHDPERMIGNPRFPAEEIKTPVGVVYVLHLVPLWTCWFEVAKHAREVAKMEFG